MSSFRIRPRFKQLTKEPATQLQKRMLEKIDQGLAKFSTTAVEGHITLAIPTIDKHFWSPTLNLSFEETDKGTVIRGLYGPNPTVWAIFFFGYIALGILALFALIAGSSQWMLGMGAPILWVLPVCAVIALVLYFVAQAGQKMGAEQMFRLHHFYEDTVGSVVHID